MNQNDALKRARLVLGADAQVGLLSRKGGGLRRYAASKAHNVFVTGNSFDELIGFLETHGIPRPPEPPPLEKRIRLVTG